MFQNKTDVGESTDEADFLEKLTSFIDENLSDSDIGIDTICNFFNTSQSSIYRKVKSSTNQSPNQFIRSYRLNKAFEILRETDEKISEVSYKVGFTSAAYFTKCFKNEYKFLPSEISKN